MSILYKCIKCLKRKITRVGLSAEPISWQHAMKTTFCLSSYDLLKLAALHCALSSVPPRFHSSEHVFLYIFCMCVNV